MLLQLYYLLLQLCASLVLDDRVVGELPVADQSGSVRVLLSRRASVFDKADNVGAQVVVFGSVFLPAVEPSQVVHELLVLSEPQHDVEHDELRRGDH